MAVMSVVWVLVIVLLTVEAVPLAQNSDGKRQEEIFFKFYLDFNLIFLKDKPVPEAEKKNSTIYSYVTPEVMSTVVGAALGDEDCIRYSACMAGNYVAGVTGKEIVLM